MSLRTVKTYLKRTYKVSQMEVPISIYNQNFIRLKRAFYSLTKRQQKKLVYKTNKYLGVRNILDKVRIIQQYNNIPSRIRLNTETKILSVELSASQGSPLGKIVGDIYYRTNLLTEYINLVSSTGCPHNGGSHDLTIKGPAENVWLFLHKVINHFKFQYMDFAGDVINFSNDKVLPKNKVYIQGIVELIRIQKYVSKFLMK